MAQLAVRCRNTRVHQRGEKLGNLLVVLSGDSLFVQCSDTGCRRWTRLRFTLPGVKLDFGKMALEQSLAPKGCRFDVRRAPVVVTEDE